jgi:hypothetical protein
MSKNRWDRRPAAAFERQKSLQVGLSSPPAILLRLDFASRAIVTFDAWPLWKRVSFAVQLEKFVGLKDLLKLSLFLSLSPFCRPFPPFWEWWA